MKLAEALLERKDITRQISSLVTRFGEAAVIEEGGPKPEEDWRHVADELDLVHERLNKLMVSINKTNNEAKVGGASLMEMLAHRDTLKVQINTVTSLTHYARTPRRYRGEQETKMVLAEGLTPSYWNKKLDDLNKQLRLLDAKIQQANWNFDLVE